MKSNLGDGVQRFQKVNPNLPILLFLSLFCLGFLGCAEGYFWRTGKYAPWVQQQWEAEEQIADTLFARKRRMSEAVAAVVGAPVEQQQEVANKLSELILRDPILLMRLHAIKLITALDCPKTVETLSVASTDPNSDIRIAAIRSWEKLPGEQSVFQLQEILANDSDDDVRMAATRALGNFQGQAAIRALSLALKDRNPALQIGATESLMRATGEQQNGRNVAAWQTYVQQVLPEAVDSGLAPSDTQSFGDRSNERMAEKPTGMFR